MSLIVLDAEQKRLVSEIGRRQVQAGKADLTQARAAVALKSKYGLKPNVEDLGRGGGVDLVMTDEKNRTVRLFKGLLKNEGDFDVAVHYEAAGSSIDLIGWITREELGQCSDLQLNEKALAGLPETFDFESRCSEYPCLQSGVWDYESGCWDCFWCGKLRYHEADRQSISGTASKVPEAKQNESVSQGTLY